MGGAASRLYRQWRMVAQLTRALVWGRSPRQGATPKALRVTTGRYRVVKAPVASSPIVATPMHPRFRDENLAELVAQR